ncbi:MAG: DUF2857 family protein [Thiotrichaceae bacterium]|nr:DUF2857 family protein [Thiotrichaceae bacterium]
MYKVDHIQHLYLTLMKTSLEIITEHYSAGDIHLLNNFGAVDSQLIKGLQSLTIGELNKLCQFTIPVIEPKINNRVLGLALKHVKQESANDRFYEELICHGATLSFVKQFTTIDKHDFTRRRKKLGISGVGSSKTPSIDEAFQIDELWEQLPDDMSDVEKYLFAAKKLNLSISTIRNHHQSIGIYG